MLLKIDDLSVPDHSLLSPGDACYYIREYTSRVGYQASPNNQLVFNLKCPVGASSSRLYWKSQAILQASRDLAQAFEGMPVQDLVFIPLPPSKAPTSATYDPRVRDMLKLAEAKAGIKVVEALATKEDREAAHEHEARPNVEEVVANLVVTSTEWVGTKIVAIFDDLLVTGTQFKAAVRVLQQFDPAAKFVGVFWVRRTFP